MKKLLFILLAFPLFTIITGCSEGLKYELGENIKPSEPFISAVNIYLEASYSMKGFVKQINPNDDYTLITKVPYLITDCHTKLEAPQELYRFITDTPEHYTQSDEEFISQLWDGSTFTGKSSKLQNILRSVIDSTNSNELTIFISDCILDLGGGLTLEKRSRVTTQINDLLSDKEDFSAALFQFYSDFNGDFYYCSFAGKTNRYFNEELHNRPFYIWLFGKPEIIQHALSKGILEDYNNAYYWGTKGTSIKPILVSHPRRGEWERINNSIKINDISEKNPVQFTLGVNLSNLPKEAQEKEFLEANLEIGNISSVKVSLSKEFEDNKREEISNLSKDKRFTHFFIFTLKNITSNTGDIEIYLPNNWLSDANLDRDLDDNNHMIPAEDIEKKTFSLKYITDAFDRKFEEKSILFKITLKQIKL